MANVGSLPVEGNKLFDLDTQAGITALLLAVRASALDASEKNELRDLVFLYTNGGRDQSVRLALLQKIEVTQLQPTAPKAAAASREPKRELPAIGTFRSAPSFSIPAAPVVPVKTMTDSVSGMAPLQSMQVSQAAPAPAEQVPVFVPQAAPVSIAPLAAEPAPAENEVAVPAVTLPKADQQQHLLRIREIKSLVNEKVGNPVNLVDINNEVGREYMSALLDAMKRINSGMSAEGAMQRLEAAFKAVEVTLSTVTPESPAATAQSADVGSWTAPPAMQAKSEPVYQAPSAEPVSVPPQPAAQSTPSYQPLVSSSVPMQPLATPSPMAPQPTAEPVVEMPTYVASAPTQPSPATQNFSSLADMVQQSHAQAGLPTTPVAAAPLRSGDPLLSPQVEEGLTQLLSEWSIFKKSGLFGSGPKGREHPLYKKMADLQIPLLLAGRFEGATQEVRQSLTDYMNGWRYEQGLIYEKGETFEHYLRRVISHILEQNTR